MQLDTEYKYTVRVDWSSDWNLICSTAVELFGLPGDKFVTHAELNFMTFNFKEEVDAIHFSLACL